MVRYLYICMVFSLLVACNSKSPSKIEDQAKLNQLTPNIAYVLSTYEDAWSTTLKIVQYDFLLPIEIKDQKQGYFSTVLIKDYTDTPARRYRLTGDLSSNDKETMIKLYKSEQIKMDDGSWKTRLSNLALEKEIVKKIQSELEKK